MKPKFRAGGLTIIQPGPICQGLKYFPGQALAKKRGKLFGQHCFKCNKVHWYAAEKIVVRWSYQKCPGCVSRTCPDHVRFRECKKHHKSS